MSTDQREPITWGESWLVVAWMLGLLQLLLEVAARRSSFAAAPALAAFHVAVALAVVLVGAATVRRGATWRVAAAFVGTVVVIAGRLALSAINPTAIWLVPVVLVAPVALSLEVMSWPRARRWVGIGTLDRVATTWCGVASVALAVQIAGPERWAQVGIRPAELRATAWSIGGVAALGLLATAARGLRRAAVRFTVVALSGVAAALTIPDLGEPVPGSVVALAAVALLATATASERVTGVLGRSVGVLRRGASGAAHRGRVAVTRASPALRRGASRPGRAWHRLLGGCAPQPPSGRPTMTTGDRIGASVMAAGSAAFILTGAAWAHGAGWQPSGHAATLLARASDVGTKDHPLLGMVTSLGEGGIGGAHPGPLLQDVLAPFVRVFGLQNGALVGGVVVGLVCWTVTVWAAWRAGGRIPAICAWVAGGLVLEIAALGAVWEANNVSITLLAIFAAIMASWAASTGTWRAWWWAVGLGSLCAQAYLPHMLVVLGPVLWSGLSVAGAARSAAEPDERQRARTAVRLGWVVAAVAWAQPLIDVVVNRGGNVRALIEQVPNGAPTVGPIGAPEAIAWILTVPPRWVELTGSFAQTGDASGFLGGSLLVGGTVATALGVLWWRTRRSTPANERQLRIVAALVLVGAALNATMLPKEFLRTFQLGWLIVVSLFLWFTVAVSLAFAVRDRIPAEQRRRWAPRTTLLGLCGAAAVLVVLGLEAPRAIAEVKGRPYTIDAMIDPLVDGVVEDTPRGEQVLVLGLDSKFNEAVTDTVIANLIVRGLDVAVEPGTLGLNYGRRRIVDDSWTGPMLWVTTGVAPIEPQGRLVASASMPGWSREEFDRLASRVGVAARAAEPIEVEPWAMEGIPRYLSGWVDGEVCDVAEDLRTGRRTVSSLPDGLILTLYGEQAISIPGLDRTDAEDAASLVGQGPIEIWRIDRDRPGLIDSTQLLRDGSECP